MEDSWFFVWYCCLVLVQIRAEPINKWEQLLWTAKNSSKWSRNHGNVSSSFQKTPTRLVLTPSEPSSPVVSEVFPNDSLNEYYRIHYGGSDKTSKSSDQQTLKHSKTNKKAHPGKSIVYDFEHAIKHRTRIHLQYPCKKPLPKVIKVQDVHPAPSSYYYPRCTVVHKCDDSTGCCSSDNYHCVPLVKQNVTLPFIAITVSTGLTRVMALNFENHTACHCELINQMPRIARQTPGLVQLLTNRTEQHSVKCRECPVPFTSRTYKDGRCGCDCFDRQKACLRIKKGRIPLFEVERRCVEAKYCHVPDCEHGVFDVSTGFCPKRHDEDQRPIRHSNSHYRWNFPERD